MRSMKETGRASDGDHCRPRRVARRRLPVGLHSGVGYWKDRLLEFEMRGFGDVEGAICLAHVADTVLASKLTGLATERTCVVCHRNVRETERPLAVPLENLLLEISAALHRHYVDAHVEGVPWDSEDGQYMGAEIYEIYDVVNEICSGAFTEDVFDELVEMVVAAFGFDVTWTDARGAYSLDSLDWQWETFVETVQSKSRFVFVADDGAEERSSAPRQMAAFLNQLATYVDGKLNLIDHLAPGTVLYRGRLMDSPRALQRKCKELQPAPPAKATANRMSPAGIPMFYASADPQTAIAEIAGHGPQPYAMIGAFRSTRQLRLLDLTRKPTFPSYFDEAKHQQFGMARFLKSFVQSITQPIIPDGRQHVEYTPTQVLTEYFRWMPNNRIDGITLPSAQTHEKTYALFFGGEAFADEGDNLPRRPDPFLLDSHADRSPVFTLAKDDIHVYEVKRNYSGTLTSF